jgi:hypothetical protein
MLLGWHPSNVSGVRWTGATLNRETSCVRVSTRYPTKKSGVGLGDELGCKGLIKITTGILTSVMLI